MSLKRISGALVALVLSSSAHAENPHVNTQVFRPSPHAYDLFSTATTEHTRAWDWAFGLWASYGQNPLVFVDLASGARQEVIADQLSLSALGALSLTDWLSVGVEIPFFALLDGDDTGFIALDPVPATALGDIRLSAKIGIITRGVDEDGFGLGLELPVSLPTGDGDAFVSDGLAVTPTVVADLRAGPLLVAVNLGARIRGSEGLVVGNEVKTELVVRAAASVDLIADRLALLGELNTATYDFGNDTSYLEGLIGGRLTFDNGLHITLAGGRGFTEGYGSTALHVVGALGWAPPREHLPPPERDPDHDGILEPADRCPNDPEDFDKFQDDDGCPDPDNDQDGVLDTSDQCPDDAEDMDQFQDEDGCPDLDNDQDGIADVQDGPDGSCKNQPEDKDGWQDEDGCPDPDNDGDGILDAEDDCPFDPTNKCGVKVDTCEIHIDQTVYFEYDKANILPASFGILDAVAGTLLTRPVVTKLEVQGHTDNDGDDAYNQRLSQDRAAAVSAYLQGKGVAAARLSPVGYGETRPIVSNKSAAGRAKNRRVQFIILEPPQSGCGVPAPK